MGDHGTYLGLYRCIKLYMSAHLTFMRDFDLCMGGLTFDFSWLEGSCRTCNFSFSVSTATRATACMRWRLGSLSGVLEDLRWIGVSDGAGGEAVVQ